MSDMQEREEQTSDRPKDMPEQPPTDGVKEQAGQPSGKPKRGRSIAVNIIFWVILALALAVLAAVIAARVQNKTVSFFGYSFAIVLTDSMEPEIETGSLIVVKECGISADYVGQNVVFIKQSGDLAGESIVHKAIEYYEKDGDIYLVTQGVNNTVPDDDPVTADNFVGLCVASSYAAGAVASFFINYGVPVLIVVIAAPIVIKLIKYIVKTVKEPDGEDTENN